MTGSPPLLRLKTVFIQGVDGDKARQVGSWKGGLKSLRCRRVCRSATSVSRQRLETYTTNSSAYFFVQKTRVYPVFGSVLALGSIKKSNKGSLSSKSWARQRQEDVDTCG